MNIKIKIKLELGKLTITVGALILCTPYFVISGTEIVQNKGNILCIQNSDSKILRFQIYKMFLKLTKHKK